MSISIEITGLKGLRQGLEGLGRRLVTDALLMELAEEARQRIRQRTERGVDVRGRRFAPYSMAYGRAREKRGRSGERVNLLMSGRMLGNMEAALATGGNEAVLSFSDPKERAKAGYHQEGGSTGKAAKREFFGLSGDDRKALTGIVERHVEKALKAVKEG